MTTLFSYCVRYDGGSAPNPFWCICTLVICKPRIRLAAQVGDWIMGTGSRRSRAGDQSHALVYAMRVSQKMSMAEYDKWARDHCPSKVPDQDDEDPRRAAGDAIYDYSFDPPEVRPSDHTVAHRKHDLSGHYALLAEQFIYFGRSAMPLPAELQGLIKQGPGHRTIRDDAAITHLEDWLTSLGYPWGTVVDQPALWPSDRSGDSPSAGCRPLPETSKPSRRNCKPRQRKTC